VSQKPVIVSRKRVFKGKKFDYEQVSVQGESGKTHKREYVKHPGAVTIVPVLEGRGREGKSVVLVKVYRASVDQMVWECCAGTIDRGEKPAACAKRELVEETGYRPGKLVKLAAFRTSPGLSDELMHAFVATGLKYVGQDLEEDEALEVHIVSVAEAMEMIEGGEIADGKTVAALLLAARGGWLK
jgi:ADP-ribose pyrophosphatase